jgi:thiamine pyrophosphokinase
MNYLFEGSVSNNLKNPDTSVTVFKKKEEGADRLIEPFYTTNTQSFPRIESWKNTVTITVAVNHPIGDEKQCKITKIENGTCSGAKKINNFKWELEITSTKESMSDPNNTAIEVEISD